VKGVSTMNRNYNNNRGATRIAATGLAVVAGLGLAGCGSSEPTHSQKVGNVYEKVVHPPEGGIPTPHSVLDAAAGTLGEFSKISAESAAVKKALEEAKKNGKETTATTAGTIIANYVLEVARQNANKSRDVDEYYFPARQGREAICLTAIASGSFDEKGLNRLVGYERELRELPGTEQDLSRPNSTRAAQGVEIARFCYAAVIAQADTGGNIVLPTIPAVNPMTAVKVGATANTVVPQPQP